MEIKLSDHFDCKRLLRFTMPSVVMMMFTSVYGVVDGLFVSNFAGKTPFAAINIILPYIMLFTTVGFMFGTGGSALVSRIMGEGDPKKANRLFSLIIYSLIALGIIFTIIALLSLRSVSRILGAEGEMLEYCVLYGKITMPALTPYILQIAFHSFCPAAGKPKLGLGVTVAAGVTNIVLDGLFVGVLGAGLAGAAAATAISQLLGGFVPLIYFALPNDSLLRLGRTGFDSAAMLKVCSNGSSEMLTNMSLSLVNILYNFQLMKYAGENGIAAYGVIMYINFIFIAVFIGYSIGSAPIVSFSYGAENHRELKSIFKKSLALIGGFSLGLTLLAQVLARPLSGVFVGYDVRLADMTHRAFMLYSSAFLIMGFNIYASSFFTALNNGLVSAAISFLRTIFFQTAAVFILPVFMGLDGIWLALAAAELLSLFVSISFLLNGRKKYGYA